MPGTPFELSSSTYYRIDLNNQHDSEISRHNKLNNKAELEDNQHNYKVCDADTDHPNNYALFWAHSNNKSLIM